MPQSAKIYLGAVIGCGAALVFVALNTSFASGWAPSLLVLPAMLLAYKYYAQWMARPEQAVA